MGFVRGGLGLGFGFAGFCCGFAECCVSLCGVRVTSLVYGTVRNPSTVLELVSRYQLTTAHYITQLHTHTTVQQCPVYHHTPAHPSYPHCACDPLPPRMSASAQGTLPAHPGFQ
ncbi:hypothetical protein BDW22DRAFT_1353539 [Trametopsis cervina]|nr:hypothetical protein BDW22DRAFT_1353539 [Trametopsis cervina]